MPYYLGEQGDQFFPHPFLADQDGLLAVTDQLNADMVLTAYHFGIFPWYNAGEQVLWWFTHPRMVLFPDKLKVSKSMRNVLNQNQFNVTFNQDFIGVMTACRQVNRKGQEGTWIHDEMIDVYTDLHQRGFAHSVEVYRNGELAGGLYGIKLGQLFFGESMFAHESNASKVALIHLVDQLKKEGFHLIDCQQDTNHMRSMGAELISGEAFFGYVRENLRRV